MQLDHERALSYQNLASAGGSMSRQDVIDVQLQRAVDHPGPVADVSIRSEVVRTIGHRVAGAQDLLLRQIYEAVAARVGPAKKAEFHATRAVGDDVRRISEG